MDSSCLAFPVNFFQQRAAKSLISANTGIHISCERLLQFLSNKGEVWGFMEAFFFLNLASWVEVFSGAKQVLQ